MAKLIELKEAAAILGMTAEELADLRTRNEIFGYRDGSTWKFKESELERFAAQQGLDLSDPQGDESRVGVGPVVDRPAVIDEDLDELVEVGGVDESDDDQDTEGPDSVLISEEELGGSDPSASSTIIGRNQLGGIGSDLQLKGADSAADAPSEQGELTFDISDESGGGESENRVADDAAPDLGGSELRLAPASDIDLSGGESEISLDGEPTDDSPTAASGLRSGRDSGSLAPGGSEIDLDAPPAVGGSSELRLAPGSELSLDEAGDTGALRAPDSAAGDSAALEIEGSELSLGASSDVDMTSSDFDLDLDASDTDLNVVGSGIDSDITLGAGDSGINLNTPSDSGISLETTPPELAGSDIESLELGEADIVDLGDDAVELDDATLQADDDFLLTPVEAEPGEDTESGSQVIALDSEEIDAGEATVLGEGFAEPVMEADPELATLPEGGEGLAVAGAVTEAPFSVAQIISLGGIVVVLALSGCMMVDVVLHIWAWDEPYTLNSTLIDAITGMFG